MDAKPATVTSTAPEFVEEAIVEIRTYCDKCIAYCTGTHELKDFYSIRGPSKRPR